MLVRQMLVPVVQRHPLTGVFYCGYEIQTVHIPLS